MKSQLLAGTTLANDFHANEMLWQLSVLAYNLSVMKRRPPKKDWQQEHATFRDWFITLPAVLVRGALSDHENLPALIFQRAVASF